MAAAPTGVPSIELESAEAVALMETSDYPTELLLSYEEEMVGASLFAQLSTFHDGPTAQTLRSIAHVERIMADALRPSALARCAHLTWRSDDVLHRTGCDEASELRGLSPRELASRLALTCALAIDEIARVRSSAPEAERAVMQQYLEHEQAIADALQRMSDAEPCAAPTVDAWIARYSIDKGPLGCRK